MNVIFSVRNIQGKAFRLSLVNLYKLYQTIALACIKPFVCVFWVEIINQPRKDNNILANIRAFLLRYLLSLFCL